MQSGYCYHYYLVLCFCSVHPHKKIFFCPHEQDCRHRVISNALRNAYSMTDWGDIICCLVGGKLGTG